MIESLQIMGPSREEYRHHSEKIYFTYSQNHSKFQDGYLGLRPSRVMGIFHIRYPPNNPLKAERIDLHFKGKSSVRWRHGDNETHFEKKFCKLSKTIWSSGAKGVFEDLITMDVPFEFNLPDHIPASVAAVAPFESGHISYTIKAKIHRCSNYLHFQGHTKVVECWVNISRWILPPTPDYSPEPLSYITSTFKCHVSLDQSKFGINDVIHVPIRLTLIDMRAFVKKVTVILKEYNKLKSRHQCKLIKGRVIEDMIDGGKILPMNNGNEFAVAMKLDLRKLSSVKRMNCTCKTELIDIWYKVKVKVHMGNAGFGHKTLEKEVELYNVLSDDELVAELEERGNGAGMDESWITEPPEEGPMVSI